MTGFGAGLNYMPVTCLGECSGFNYDCYTTCVSREYPKREPGPGWDLSTPNWNIGSTADPRIIFINNICRLRILKYNVYKISLFIYLINFCLFIFFSASLIDSKYK